MSTNRRISRTLRRASSPALAAGGLLCSVLAMDAIASGETAARLMYAGPEIPADTWEADQSEKRIPYKLNVQNSCSGTGGICDVTIDSVNSNRRLEIDHISCILVSMGSPIALAVYFGEVSDFFPVESNASGYAVVSSPTRFTVPAGNNISLAYFATADVNLVKCVVSGTMVVLN